ncbi:MAG: 1-deoxy-D-xylulose-5-phosphate reductoisomerase [Clostridia bacterium]|nr:1-deoxy-D-xylulose-5-phosphate reductoisomerase [Clostridia bacterium]
MDKTIAILGATGSVGTQAIDVARARGYRVDLLTANRDFTAMESFARELRPRYVAMADESAAHELTLRLADTNIKVIGGETGVLEGIFASRADTVVNSILGEAGLRPSLAVIDANKRLALANKESLVIAGEIVMARAKERGVDVLPVDSEHCAIFQSMKAGRHSEVKRLILTASGGPFFGCTREQLGRVTREDALAHPTWKMGKKITVDSATLMNKGFEVIEAVHLFGIPADKIEVVVHRESILHSAVEYIDNSVVGELSVPDMRMCVQYAVDYPSRCPSTSSELDLFSVGKLTFFRPDTEAFPFLALAKRLAGAGGAMPAVMNAADEVAVDAFLRGELSFIGIYDTVLEVCDRLSARSAEHTLDGIRESDREARALAREFIENKTTAKKIGGNVS